MFFFPFCLSDQVGASWRYYLQVNPDSIPVRVIRRSLSILYIRRIIAWQWLCFLLFHRLLVAVVWVLRIIRVLRILLLFAFNNANGDNYQGKKYRYTYSACNSNNHPKIGRWRVTRVNSRILPTIIFRCGRVRWISWCLITACPCAATIWPAWIDWGIEWIYTDLIGYIDT